MSWISELRFLITGCGGDIGQSICKILKERGCFAAGCDTHHKHPGDRLYDATVLVPRSDAENYFAQIESAVKEFRIDVVIPMSETEIRLYNEKRITSIAGSPVLMASSKSMDIGFDKLATADFLKSIGQPYPWTIVVKKGEPKQLPCILKDRTGHGSTSVIRIEEGLVEHYKIARPEAIWQELLLPDNEEYTCGVFSDSKETRSIILHRDLARGLTEYAETTENEQITSLLESLAKALQLKGSINVQLRMTDRGPIIFEINPRFSSTVQFRHIMGFHDLLWSIELLFDKPISPYTPVAKDIRIYKGSELYLLD